MTLIQNILFGIHRRCFSIALLVVCFFLLTGCGSPKNPRAKDLVPGTGNITVNGEPLIGAMISFIPAEDNQFATQSVAMSDVKGYFEATTFTSSDGIHPGNYIVTVICDEDTGPRPSAEAIAEMEAQGKPISSGDTTRSQIPVRYNSPQTSGLTLEIPPKGHRRLSIALESK